MAPHADTSFCDCSWQENNASDEGVRNSANLDGPKMSTDVEPSLLCPTQEDDLHDLICVGFGPASLATAIALHDEFEQVSCYQKDQKSRGENRKVAFIERQPHFAWHAGMLLPGARMQINFIKDLATLRNPRSEFTFLNYLFKKNRLVEFTNLGTFLPQRIEFEDYMRWCAKHFDHLVDYDNEVFEILPKSSNDSDSVVDYFTISSRNNKTNEVKTRRARHVVIAIGGRPSIPKSFPQNHPRIIHSSKFSYIAPKIFKDPLLSYKVAVVGSGQSAAELFENIQTRYPNSQTRLLIRGDALRPSDDSPFVNEIFNPSRVDDIYSQPAEIRADSISQDRNTNYGVVRIDLLERIYETLYTQRIRYNSEDEWPHRILKHRDVLRIEGSPVIDKGVRLHVRNESGEHYHSENSTDETLDVDVVFFATGYQRNVHEDLLKSCRHLMPGGNAKNEKWTVGRNYRVNFEPNTVSNNAGLWLQGCCEDSHGLSDSLLSIVSTRGGELITSIFDDCSNNLMLAKDTVAAEGLNGYH